MNSFTIFQTLYLTRAIPPFFIQPKLTDRGNNLSSQGGNKRKENRHLDRKCRMCGFDSLTETMQRQEDRAPEQSPRLDSTSVAVGTERRAQTASEQPVKRLSALPPQTGGKSAFPNCFTSSEQPCKTLIKWILILKERICTCARKSKLL